ncbi:hypothetical protein [Pseudoxanthomonas japonensis]|uniref:hypothetical protein n=1 Tax=Pseudoxanthomonas japonensis TaxID=69284 RepID=UPI001390D296|nr:hypothetical protein [Pseudoxanthomonas japonensis]
MVGYFFLATFRTAALRSDFDRVLPMMAKDLTGNALAERWVSTLPAKLFALLELPLLVSVLDASDAARSEDLFLVRD